MPRAAWPMRSPIGVDLAGRRVKIAQCARGLRGGVRLETCVQAVRPVPVERSAELTPDDAALVAGLVERSGFVGRSVVLNAPPGVLLSTALELPPRSSGAPLAQIARLELARAHRVEPDSFEMAMWEVPSPARSSEGSHALAVGLPIAKVEPFLAAMDAQGLDVVAIDSRSLALARATAPLHAMDGMTCIVDANWHGLSILMCMNGVVVVDRAVDAAAWAEVCTQGATRLSLSPDRVHDGLVAATAAPSWTASLRSLTTEYLDQVVPESARSVTYTSHRYPNAPLAGVLVTGDAATLPGLADRLAQALGVRTLAVDPSLVIHTPLAGRSRVDAACLGALGLSLHAGHDLLRRAA